jgi:hypothetical protein
MTTNDIVEPSWGRDDNAQQSGPVLDRAHDWLSARRRGADSRAVWAARGKLRSSAPAANSINSTRLFHTVWTFTPCRVRAVPWPCRSSGDQTGEADNSATTLPQRSRGETNPSPGILEPIQPPLCAGVAVLRSASPVAGGQSLKRFGTRWSHVRLANPRHKSAVRNLKTSERIEVTSGAGGVSAESSLIEQSVEFTQSRRAIDIERLNRSVQTARAPHRSRRVFRPYAASVMPCACGSEPAQALRP